MARGNRTVKRVTVGCFSLLFLLVLLLFITPYGRHVRNIWGTGAIQDAISGTDMREYNATSEANLKAIHTALMLYHDSEGQFPETSGWMDAIQNRILVNDMTGEEAGKKLVTPSLLDKPDEYGYAMNDEASEQYIDDIDPKMPLVFDSSDTKRNAHGSPDELLPNPPRDGQNLAISVDGTILRL